MKLNKTFEYTICAINYLEKTNNGEFISAREIAQHENLPVSYLPKILKNLTKAGILDSIRGQGYTLSKPLDEITLKELSDAVDANGSAFLPEGSVIYNGLKERIDKLLSEIKLSEIVNYEED